MACRQYLCETGKDIQSQEDRNDEQNATAEEQPEVSIGILLAETGDAVAGPSEDHLNTAKDLSKSCLRLLSHFFYRPSGTLQCLHGSMDNPGLYDRH